MHGKVVITVVRRTIVLWTRWLVLWLKAYIVVYYGPCWVIKGGLEDMIKVGEANSDM